LRIDIFLQPDSKGLETFGGHLVEITEHGFPVQPFLQFLHIEVGHLFLQFFLECFPFAFCGGCSNTLFILLSNSQFLFLVVAIFRQVVTHGLAFFFLFFLEGGRNGSTPVLVVRIAGCNKGIRLFQGQSVPAGGYAGFLVLTLPGGFLPVYLFFPGVIVIFDLCQFLFGAGLHAVYLCLPVLCLQGGKFLR